MSYDSLVKIKKLVYEQGPDKSQKGDFRLNVPVRDIQLGAWIEEASELKVSSSSDREAMQHFNVNISRILSVLLTIFLLEYPLLLLRPVLSILTGWTHQLEPSDTSTLMNSLLALSIVMYRFLVALMMLWLVIKYLYKGCRYATMKILNYVVKRTTQHIIIEPLTFLMNQVLINKHDKFDFLLLGECLDPDYSTSETLSFIIPEGFIHVNHVSLTDQEERALFDVVNADRFDLEDVTNYYESLVNMTEVRDINYKIAQTEERLKLMEQFRERRGDGNHQKLNQRFSSALKDLNTDVDDTLTQSNDYMKAWSNKDEADDDGFVETKHVKKDNGVSVSFEKADTSHEIPIYRYKPDSDSSFPMSREKRRVKRLSDFSSTDEDLNNQSY